MHLVSVVGIFGNLTNLIHGGTLPKQVYRDHRLGRRSDHLPQAGSIHVERLAINVDKHGAGSQASDGTGSRKKSKAGADDFITGANFQGHECQQQGVASRRTTNGMFDIAKFTNRFF